MTNYGHSYSIVYGNLETDMNWYVSSRRVHPSVRHLWLQLAAHAWAPHYKIVVTVITWLRFAADYNWHIHVHVAYSDSATC